MLTNKELTNIQNTITLLKNIEKSAYFDFYVEFGVTQEALLDSIEQLETIYTKAKALKVKQSASANAWNKAHPERHREINKQYEKRKKEVK